MWLRMRLLTVLAQAIPQIINRNNKDKKMTSPDNNFHPLFITPAYGGQVTVPYTLSMMSCLNTLNLLGIKSNYFIGSSSSLVTRARNEMAVEFLANREFTHLFWVDADVGFSAESVLRFLRSDLDVVAGLYPIKRFDWPVDIPDGATRLDAELVHRLALKYPVNSDINSPEYRQPNQDGFMQVTEAPTGFMCIKRSVFDQMIKEYPNLQYVPDSLNNWKPERAALCYRFFDVLFDETNRRYLSEDYAFCRRWRDIGGQVHVCAQTKLSHTGEYTFYGDPASSLAIRPNDAIGGIGGRPYQL